MRLQSRIALVALFALGLLVTACVGQQGPEGPLGPAGAPGPMGPVGPAGLDATASQTYVGSERCGQCHEDIYASFAMTGHPNDLTAVEGGQAPALPNDAVTGGLPEPPPGYTWDDISYVVGGVGWMARFVDTDGYVITGDGETATQYNYANELLGTEAGWVQFHPGEELSFDCGACHTTGYRPQGRQDGMQGIAGTWAFDGVQCERCHGPGSRHADDPYGVVMKVDYSARLCGDCHVRGDSAAVAAADGFAEHNQQFSDLFNSKHFALDCVTCHDPHASTVVADEASNSMAGLRQACESCHWEQLTNHNRRHSAVECVDCHMPPMAKSAVGNLELFTADIRSHQFSINPDPTAPQFSEDGTSVMPYITLDYACRQCHNGERGGERDDETLEAMARDYHSPATPTPMPSPTPEPTATAVPTPEP